MKLLICRIAGALARYGGGVIAALVAALAWPAAAQELQAPNIEVKEGEVAVFEFTLPNRYDFAIRYAYRTRDGSAKSGPDNPDYEAKRGHVVFPTGSRTAQTRVQTLSDRVVEHEYFDLVLSDLQTRGLVPGSNAWTSALRVKYLPVTKTVRARIIDTIDSAGE